MNGSTVTAGPLVSSGVPLALQIVGIGDLNNDGKADLFWRNVQTGDISTWLMNGATVTQSSWISTVPLVWQTAGVGDLNGDGRDDLVWRHSQTGDLAVWLMNGPSVSQGPVISNGVPLVLQIVGVGDLDSDGNADLLWRNSQTGDVSTWLMNGATVKQSVGISTVPLVWQTAGVGDLDGDGRDDVIWRNSQTGDVAVWLMNGAIVSQAPVIAAGVPLAWQIVVIEDVNGDGKSDLVWRNSSSGAVAVWIMNGAAVIQSPVVSSGVALAWQIQPATNGSVAPIPPSVTQFGNGIFLVGSNIPPGRYYSAPVGGCYWARLSGLGGTFGEIIANEFIPFIVAQWIVDILPSDRAFSTDPECGTWYNTPRQGFQANIPPGVWLVGSQIAGGTYRANAQYGCYWERVRDFTNNLSAIIANDFVDSAGSQLVSISAGDAGFRTDVECGVWTRISSATSSTTTQSLSGISTNRALAHSSR
jgi:hypothetical protein